MIKSRRKKRAGLTSRMGARRCACRILVGKRKGKRPGKPRRRLEENIKMSLQEVGLR